MYLRIDPNNGTPLGTQIVRGLKLAITQGRLTPGEQLPSARVLAGELSVNFHTVRKAYGDLEAEGLLEFRRGKGTYVSEQVRQLTPLDVRELARPHIRRLLEDLAGCGEALETVQDIVAQEIRDAFKRETPK